MRRILRASGLVALLLSLVAVPPSAALARRSLTLSLHTSVTISGNTLGPRPGHPARGHVFATARWNHGPRYVVAAPATDALGRWKVTFHPSNRGFYTLRILTPDAGVLEYAFTVR